MPTRSDWPHEEFVAWLDATRDKLSPPNDAALADYLGTGHTLISNWRRNKQRPSWDVLLGISHTIGEDPRQLWVLTGLASAVDVGLLADPDDEPEGTHPAEIRRLIEVYDDPRMDDDDRAAMLRAVRMVYQGVLADLDQRDRERPATPDRPGRRRSSG